MSTILGGKMKENERKVNKIIKYLLERFGFNGGRYLVLDESIGELVDLIKVDKSNLPDNFYDLVRNRWKEIIKNH